MIIPALHRKLVRDLWRMWPQLGAATLVMSCGIATLTMGVSMISTIERARADYYERYRFPDVFSHLKRAPNSLRERLAEIPGVSRVVTRVVVDVNLDVPGMHEPAIGRFISIPEHPPFGLAELHLRHGRLPDPGRTGQVVVSEAFAEANHLASGSKIRAIINGSLEEFTIVGIALSPEYIYQVRGGDLLPDPKRFGIFWMPERELAPAYDLDGAFNDVVIALAPGASEAAVIADVDRLTAPYGGQGAHERRDQVSHKFVSNELEQLRAMSMIPPTIFLATTAFILNIVFARLVRTQREQIAALKAFGYGNGTIAAHYLGMGVVVATIGTVIGITAGALLGRYLTGMYAEFFRFPVFEFAIDPRGVAMALSIACGAVLFGTLNALRRAAQLPPAEAMRPERPPDYHTTLVERWKIQRLFGPMGRMILRHLERQPVRALFTMLGISLSVAVLIVGSFMHGALDFLIEFMFSTTQRQDMTVTFVEPASPSAADEIARLDGVIDSEAFRSVPARIRAGARWRLQGILGLEHLPRLNRVVDVYDQAVAMPVDGILMSDILAAALDVKAGDVVTVEVLEGQRPVIEVPITAVTRSYVGTAAYMDVHALNRLLHEGDVISGAFLQIDAAKAASLYRTLKETPRVAGVTLKSAALDSFEVTVAENLLLMRLFNLVFASVIAFGVIYNSARIALAERAHELATLRILGFTRAEVSWILLGELAILTALAIGPGLLIGRTLARVLTSSLGGETVRIPFVIMPSTYAFAVTVVAIAALVSGLVVRRNVDTLDLVEVLKSGT